MTDIQLLQKKINTKVTINMIGIILLYLSNSKASYK